MALATLLSGVAATGASQGIRTDGLVPAHVQISGITIGTVAVQGSVDGTTWATVATALTADGIVTLATPTPYIRANVTAFTSGSITVKIFY
jgi:hypothetical protein